MPSSNEIRYGVIPRLRVPGGRLAADSTGRTTGTPRTLAPARFYADQETYDAAESAFVAALRRELHVATDDE